jgi:hypothetical protein
LDPVRTLRREGDRVRGDRGCGRVDDIKTREGVRFPRGAGRGGRRGKPGWSGEHSTLVTAVNSERARGVLSRIVLGSRVSIHRYQ